MKIKKNLSGLDQLLRLGLGVVCIYLGFIDNRLIESEVLALLVGVFGIINIVFSLIGACPIYWLAGINTTANYHASSASLKTRNKLLTTFILVSVTIVSIFAVVSYQISKEFSIAEEVKLWEKFNRQKASAIAKNEAIDNSAANEVNQFILLDKDLNPIDTELEIIKPADFGQLVEKIKTRMDKERSGHDVIADQAIIWALTSVPGSTNNLLVIHKMVSNEFSTGDLAKKFFIAAFVLQWFSVWGALILSSTVSKRINKQNDLIVYQALHDQLTGLPNRKLLLDKIKIALSGKPRIKETLVLFVFDVNRFKDINNLLGQHSGDYLLAMLAKRLEGVIAESETLARLDGNEFAILSPETNSQSLTDRIDAIFQTVDAPFLINDMEIQCEISLGLAKYAEEIKAPMDLIRQAEIAMFCSKERSQDYVIFSPEMDNQSTHNLTVISELRHAISNNELCLYYQPKVNLKHGNTESLEALIRWKHPERGMQFPDTFIPQAEQTGLIKSLTLWTIREALRQAKCWKSQGISLPVAINFSQRLLSHEHLVGDIADLLHEYAIDPQYLELEITESAVMSEAGGALDMIAALSELGIPLSIDDFGTGYTSMSHIQELPIQTIKIDKSFVLNLSQNKHDQTIVNSIINFVHDMGHRVVAEGIEDIESWNKLEKMGCNVGQGYYMSRPMPAAEVVPWLRHSEWPLTGTAF